MNLRFFRFFLLTTFIVLISGCVGTDNNDDFVPVKEDTGNYTDIDTDDTDAGLFTYDSDYFIQSDFNFDFSGLPFVGVNMSGAEWDGGVQWPDRQLSRGYVSFPNYYKKFGMNTVRLPFKWERLQPELNGEFDEKEFNRLKTTAYTLRKDRAKVILDCHNYARYNGKLIGVDLPDEAMADLWRRLALEFKDYPEFIFGIMNEPYNMSTEAWVKAANLTIKTIRDAGAKNLIFLNGNGWSGAHSWCEAWTDDDDSTSNAIAMLDIVDPLGSNNTIFEVHQYLDVQSSDWGTCECNEWDTKNGCTSETVGSYRMNKCFTDWLRTNGKLGFLGEFGVQDDPACISALDDMLTYVENNSDVYVGWTWWAAGPACVDWQAATDPYCWPDSWTIGDPMPSGQMETLTSHIANNPSIY
ncbi:MAG: glycoside hydrolase family 5 protein [Deltaproteobacteria bacterium]|nr:glycoside hydrolase family 5 protein [Deltaproteobacteria bacterium]